MFGLIGAIILIVVIVFAVKHKYVITVYLFLCSALLVFIAIYFVFL